MTAGKLRPRVRFAGAVLLAISLVAVIASRLWVSTSIASIPSRPDEASIVCLGRISPDGDVIRLSARSISGQPSLVSELLVKQGDLVKRGQVLAVLDSRTQEDRRH